MIALNSLPNWVSGINEFQKNNLANKAILDLIGVEVPSLALTRNPVERKEKLFHRSVAFIAAFLFAPAHAWLIAKCISRFLNIPHTFLNVSFAHLKNLDSLKPMLAQLDSTLQSAQLETHRKKIVKGKTLLLCLDLVVQSLIFANMGWLRNKFTEIFLHKKEFTGELGAASSDELKKLYKQQSETKISAKTAQKWTLTLGSIVPITVSVLIGLSFRKASTGFWAKIADFAKHFDYHKGIFLSNLALLLVSSMSNIGDAFAARSPRERNETLIRKFSLDALFFGGEFVWMNLFSKLFNASKEVLQSSPEFKAKTFLLSFVLNTVILSGIITWTNRKTLQKLEDDLQKIRQHEIGVNHSLLFSFQIPPTFQQFESRRHHRPDAL